MEDNVEMIDIEGYPNYCITKCGKVWSKPRGGRGGSKNGRFLKPGSAGNGYSIVLLHITGEKAKACLIHRLVAKAFIPNPHNKTEVNHKNFVRNDNNINNLEWCTSSENKIHMYNSLKLTLTESI